MHEAVVPVDGVVGQDADSGPRLHRPLQSANIVDREMHLPPLPPVAAGIGEPVRGKKVGGLVATERDDAVLVQFLHGLRLTKTFHVILAGEGVVMHREKAALDQVRLGRAAHPDGHIGLAHGEIEFLVGEDHLDPHVRVEVQEFTHPLREPGHAEADRGRHLQVAGRSLRGLDEASPGVLQAQLHVLGGAEQQVALLGEDQASCVPVE